ncbi:MAG: 5-guanidino-2-oxopentanoate decarboxylase [Rhodospirillales bacterium]
MNETVAARETCGEALVGLLERYGVDTVFGIPGVHTLALYRGLAKSGIRHVLVRHEQGAAFAADGYARASGKPGVACVITGPGVTNAATGIGQAYSDSIPVLMISSVNETWSLARGSGRLHEMRDQRSLTASITGFSATAQTAAQVPGLLAKAYSLFAGERPRPVHIEIPLDVLEEAVGEDWPVRPDSGQRPPDPQALAAAVELLRQAKRPLIVLGGGALETAADLPALAEILQAPVLTTVAAKGVLPESHALAAGSALSMPSGRAFAGEADCVLVLGSELAETDLWTERLELAGQVIRVDLDPDRLNDHYRAAVALAAHCGPTVTALVEALRSATLDARDPNWGAAAVTRQHDACRAEFTPLMGRHDKVLSILREALPDNGLVMTDMTQIAYSGNVIFPVERPRSWMHPQGYGTLGYALPAAIGAKLGAPERPVVALVGDAGFLYTLQELATAVEEELPLVVLLWNNDGLGQIRDDMIDRGFQQIAVSPRNPDYLALAKAFGARAERAESLEDLAIRLRAALAHPGPVLLEVPDRIAPAD